MSFDIDANGILRVSAKDLGTGKEQKITITASSGLSKTEIEAMRKDAETHAKEDQARRAELETRHLGDRAMHRTERLLKEHGSDPSETDRSRTESLRNDLKQALEGTLATPIGTATRRLDEAWQSISAPRNSAASAKGRSGPESPGPRRAGTETGGTGPIIDAEVVEEGRPA